MEESPSAEVDPKSSQIKNRVEKWLKGAEEDASKAELYLGKKMLGKQPSPLARNGITLKYLVSGCIEKVCISLGGGEVNSRLVDTTDVIKAMETVEKAAGNRKKTPPSDIEKKKMLIRLVDHIEQSLYSD